MSENRIITFAYYACRIVQVFLLLFLFGMTFVLIHWHFQPDAYNQVELSEAFTAAAGTKGIQLLNNAPQPGDWLLSELSYVSIYWLYIRTALFILLTLLILRSIFQVLRSISHAETFHKANAHHFRSIGSYTLILFVLGSFNFGMYQGEGQFFFQLAFGPLLFALAAFVLAEVFREGSKLQEDKNLVV